MTKPFHYIDNLSQLTTELPKDSVLSRNVYRDDHVKVTLFAFAAGQELTEHTATRPAILHFLDGEAELVLGKETKQARAATWARMSAHLPHSIRAQTSMLMLLILPPSSD